MKKTTVGIVGANNIGGTHLAALRGEEDVEISGIADLNPEILQAKSAEFETRGFGDHLELIETAKPDYVVVCTPHYSHARIAIDAMERGVHVLCEKPLTICASRAAECVDIAKKTGMTLGVNFLQRLRPVHRKLFDLARSGFLGTTTRVTMVQTNWFRTMAYYRWSSWRATWEGEGGGVLVNQSPHDLDFLCWVLGPPSEVFCEMNTSGHDIEVEDDVCALLKWPDGATGTLQVTTNEAPGRNFVEIAGTRGTLTTEGDRLRTVKLPRDSREYSESATAELGWSDDAKITEHELPETGDHFLTANRNFIEAIRTGRPLMCDGEGGLMEVELANALLVSGIKRKWVHTPVDPVEFDEVMKKLIECRRVAAAKAFFSSAGAAEG